jgi:hypothetical protein
MQWRQHAKNHVSSILTELKRLSTNCNSKQDLPTPVSPITTICILQVNVKATLIVQN